MPTGGGKVAHVPGVRVSDGGRLSGGDPLIALMKDQVEDLKNRGFRPRRSTRG